MIKPGPESNPERTMSKWASTHQKLNAKVSHKNN